MDENGGLLVAADTNLHAIFHSFIEHFLLVEKRMRLGKAWAMVF